MVVRKEVEKLQRNTTKLLRKRGYLHYLDYGDGVRDVHICQNLSKCHFKYVQCIECQLYFLKALKKYVCKMEPKHLVSLCQNQHTSFDILRFLNKIPRQN